MSLLIPTLILLTSSIQFIHGCMPTEPSTTTTTTPFICCPILTSSTLLKTPPTSTSSAPAGISLEQCSILRRISSNCGDQAYLTCEAAPFTNPLAVYLQLFDANGNRFGEVQGNAQQANAILICNHLTGLYTFQGNVVSRVACAQRASSGANAPDSVFI